jgi:RNA polymerase sigma factor (sigma-70 family)
MNFTKDKELIKDCIHDLFLELYKYRDRLSGTSSIRFYLFASLKRKIVREQQKKGSILSFDPSVLPLVGKEESPDQEYVFIRQEEADHGNKLLLEAFGKLTGHQQEILFLRFNQELSYPEIAELFQISVETVRTLVYRSLKIIRSFLQESGCTFPILLLLMRPVNSCLKTHSTSLV